MTHFEKESLIICIENAAAFISETIGYETVLAAFERCGVCNLYQASESQLYIPAGAVRNEAQDEPVSGREKESLQWKICFVQHCLLRSLRRYLPQDQME